jgi:hypothetical protein
MRETRGLATLKRAFPRAHFQRIETWAGAGVFDLNICHEGAEAWVELKQCTKPKRPDTKLAVKVRAAQVAWEVERRQAGGRTWVGLTVGEGFYLLPGETLWYLKKGLAYAEILRCAVPMHRLFTEVRTPLDIIACLG